MKIIRSVTICLFFCAALTGGVPPACADEGELLFRDNFNHPDTNNFDNAGTAGRLSGSLASNILLRSSMITQAISGNQLYMVKPEGVATGRIGFHKQDLSAWYDWAAGATGTKILNSDRLRIEFDFTSPVSTGDWVAFCIGHDENNPARRIVDPQTDYGILLRGNGGSQRFDNGVVTTVGNFTSPQVRQHVVIDFAINSFADGASVDVVVTVSGIEIDNYTFTWNNNNGKLYMELGSYRTGMLIDSYSVSTAPLKKYLLFRDNFDVADTANFDNASLSGRLSGLLDTHTRLASARIQQNISENRLYMVRPTSGSGRMRFQYQTGGWYNWATNETGTLILDAGGLIVGFDFTPASITTANWISFCAGFNAAEPAARITDAQTDYGILFRGNGGTQRFDNGTGTATGSFTPSTASQHVEIRLDISSFADGERVDATATVGGTQVDSYTFELSGNSGEFYMELGTYMTGMQIDNYSVELIPPPTGTIIMIR